MKKNRCLIITFHRAHNYGAFLQVFAFQNYLRKNGINVEIVDYRNRFIENNYKPLNINTKNPIKLMKRLLNYLIYRKKLLARFNLFNSLIESKLKMTCEIKKFDDFKELINKDDVLVVGSDQVWNINITGGFDKFYYLSDIKNNKKISYAASIGDAKLLNVYAEEYKNNLNGFDRISVREENISSPIEELTGKKVSVVVDPTLLLGKVEWDEYLSNELMREKYIFAYVVQDDENFISVANYIANKKQLGIIHTCLTNPGFTVKNKSIYEQGPFEFIEYIKNADFVVTTSFHATVFSIIYHKNFIVIPHKKTGSRVENLLNRLEIKNRVVRKIDDYKELKIQKINWKEVDKRVDLLKKQSSDWIMESLSDGENINE